MQHFANQYSSPRRRNAFSLASNQLCPKDGMELHSKSGSGQADKRAKSRRYSALFI